MTAQQLTYEEVEPGELDELDIEGLLELDVTTLATRTRLSADDAPARILTLTKEEMRARGYRYLRDIFQDLPGYQASRWSDPDWDTTLVVRGLRGNNRVVFLLNGQRYSPPGNTPMPLFANWPIDFIQRVEIMYGPGSALYGSDAFSGIINIITDRVEPYRVARGSVEYGTFGSVSAAAVTEAPTKYFDVSVGGHYTYRQIPNLYKQYPDEYRYGSTGVRLDEIESADLNLRNFDGTEWGHDVFVTFKREQFALRYYQRGYSHSSSLGRSAIGAPVVNGATFKDLSQSVMVSHRLQMGRFELTSLLEYSRYEVRPDTRFVTPIALRTGDFDTNDFRAALSSSFRIDEKLDVRLLEESLLLTVGVAAEDVRVRPQATYDSRVDPSKNPADQVRPIEYLSFGGPGDTPPVGDDGIVIDADLNFRGPTTLNNVADIAFQVASLYSQLLWYPVEPLQLTVGARYDISTRFGGRVNPRASIVYRPTQASSIKLLYGRAYLEPTATQVYATLSDAGGVLFPNPDLRPEIMNSGEVVWSQDVTKYVAFTLGGFYNRVKNNLNDSAFTQEFVYVMTSAGLQQRRKLQTINAGKTEIYGGEGLVALKLDPVLIRVGASYVDGTQRMLDLRGNLETNDLIGVSKLMFKSDATADFLDKLTLHARLSYYDAPLLAFNRNDYRYAAPGRSFYLVDAHVRYLVLGALSKADEGHLALYVRGQNLLDQRYKMVAGHPGANPIGAPQPSLQVLAGVQGSLGF